MRLTQENPEVLPTAPLDVQVDVRAAPESRTPPIVAAFRWRLQDHGETMAPADL
jgi:hypothetical protein